MAHNKILIKQEDSYDILRPKTMLHKGIFMPSFKSKDVHPQFSLHARPLDTDLPPARSEVADFDHWLADEVFSQPQLSSAHQWLGFIGFLVGAVSALVVYYLAVNLMKRFGASDEVASAVGVGVLVPRIALQGNALEDVVYKILHGSNQQHKLPQKNNQAVLRHSADAFVYVSSFALGVMGIYILWNNLPYNVIARGILTPSILLGNGIVNVQPFIDANQALFAKYSPGVTVETREKRAALISTLEVSLNEIKAKNNQEFEEFYRDMSSSMCSPEEAHSRWEKILNYSLAPKQQPRPPKSNFTQARGYFGWLLSLLSSLTNIQISYAESVWLASVFHADEQSFVPSVGIISSFLCIVAYGVLCAGPTQEVFEYQTEKLGLEPSHAELRRAVVGISLILGALSAVPNASWPIILGTTWYEQSLAGPAFVSPASLYFDALNKRLNRWINAWDRHWGKTHTIDHMDFLDKLKTLPAAVAQLPDAHIDKLVSTEAPWFRKYREARSNTQPADDRQLQCLSFSPV